MQPIKDKETGLIRLDTRPYKGTGYYAVGHGYTGKGSSVSPLVSLVFSFMIQISKQIRTNSKRLEYETQTTMGQFFPNIWRLNFNMLIKI